MCTCAEPQAWTGSQTSPFEIIPVLGRSRVCGHSPREWLTLLTEFRWARHWKSPAPLSSIPFGASRKTASPATSSDFSSSCNTLSKVIAKDFSGKQMTCFTCENESLRGSCVSTVYRIGNTEYIVWFFFFFSYQALNAVHLIKRTDLFASIIKYSLGLNVLQDA